MSDDVMIEGGLSLSDCVRDAWLARELLDKQLHEQAADVSEFELQEIIRERDELRARCALLKRKNDIADMAISDFASVLRAITRYRFPQDAQFVDVTYNEAERKYRIEPLFRCNPPVR